MEYVSIDYYDTVFGGEPIEAAQFRRLAEIASDLIDSIVMIPIDEHTDRERLSRACAYQVEYLIAQGGLDAVTGHANGQEAVTEKLDDYSISRAQTDAAAKRQMSLGGIPVSPMTVSILRRMGLLNRWAYAGRKRG